MLIQLTNIYYLPKLDTNLILFGVFKKKKCEFYVVNSFLLIKDKDNDIVLKSIRDNCNIVNFKIEVT